MRLTYLTLERKKRNLNQSQLAEELDISQTHLSNIELLTFGPGKELKIKIENYFDKPIDQLLSVLEI